MKHWLKMILNICLATCLIALTGCNPKYTVIPSDRELVACPLHEGRVSISKGYLRDMKHRLDDCRSP